MTLALYRTYRPGTLAEVIGQEHVTAPMARALDSGRTHHAYLLSGPRGCGKTSTARILARSMNCVEGPSSTPCGRCQSCLDLAPNGPGSIDVVELDAATHRGIDDARDLREKAIFAPAVGQYRVYIIDEAHQLTKEAANALLKLIEEPPPHLRFIFATTEPDKILPTIRSRTFHYGFRLVPAGVLAEHLATVCQAEAVPAEPAALAAVARAGAGSVRDSLSVLGQLLAGAGPQGLTYADAVATLGLTDDSLLEAFVLALSAGSVAQMFRVVDQVIAAGHDPRRFAADLLDRLRDLLIVRADPAALTNGVIEVADDAGERLLAQAQSLGQAELSRAADLVNVGLSELKGATAPRLQLELLCARLALTPAQADTGALLARLERLERQLVAGPGAGLPPAAAGPAQAGPHAGPPRQQPVPDTRLDQALGEPTASSGSTSATSATGSGPGGREGIPDPGAAAPAPASSPPDTADPGAQAPDPPRRAPAAASRPAGGAAPPRRPQLRSGRPVADPARSDSRPVEPPPAEPGHPGSGAQAGPAAEPDGSGQAASRPFGARAGGVGLEQVKESWESVLEALFRSSRVAWTAFSGARPLSLGDGVLAVGIPDAGAALAIPKGGHDERLRQVLIEQLGLDVSVDVMHEGRQPSSPAARASTGGSPGARAGASAGGSSSRGQSVPTDDSPAPPPALSRAAAVGLAVAQGGGDPEVPDEPSDDDPDLAGADSLALIERELGARTIGEIDHS